MAETGAHKLKDLKITNVDFVDEGANKRADILITKSRDKGEGKLRRAWNAITKALGFETENDEEPVEKAATDFNAQLAQASMEEIRNEIWKFTDAINASLQSILTDEEIEDEDRLSLMEESIDQFSAAVKQAAGKWVGKQLSNIETDVNDEPDDDSQLNPKGEQVDMRIDKSKMTEEERQIYDALVKKYASDVPDDTEETEKAAAPAPKKPATKAGAVDPEDNQDEEDDDTEKCNGGKTQKCDGQTRKCDTKKSVDPIVKSLMAEIDSLKKYKEDNENKQLEGIAKKYEPLGIKSEDLVPTLKSFKAMGDDAYNRYIATLDASLNAQEQSGMFGEIGKSTHGLAGNAGHGSTAEAKIDGIAKSMCEKDPNLSYNIAKARAWSQNPDLYEEYENETGR